MWWFYFAQFNVSVCVCNTNSCVPLVTNFHSTTNALSSQLEIIVIRILYKSHLVSDTWTNLNNQKPEAALQAFSAILKKNPNSPRAHYGMAQALDRMAEKQHSNPLLQKAIDAYEKVLSLGASVPDKLYHLAADRCINRMRFKGENLSFILHGCFYKFYSWDLESLVYKHSITTT